MDHGQFDKGAMKVKSDLKSLSSVASDSLNSIGNLFGVNLGKVQQLGEAMSGLSIKMKEAGSAGTQAFGSVLQAISKIGPGIAAIGIGAAVTAFKALNSEATAFKNTIEGANIELQTQAYLETYRQAMHDVNSETGKAVAEFESGFKKWWGRLKQNASSFVVNLVTDDSESDALKAAHPMVALSRSVDSAMAKTKESIESAKKAASEAEPIAKRIYEIQRAQSDNMVKIAELDAEISAQRAIANDASYSQAEQMAAIAKAMDLIHQKYAIQIPLATELADKMDEMNSLAASSPEQIDAANQQRVKANALVRSENDEIRALLRRQNSLNAAISKEAAERMKALEAIRLSRETLAQFGSGAQLPDITGQATQATQNGPVGLEEWKERMTEAANAYAAECERIQKLNDQLQQSFKTAIADGVGSSIEALTDMLFGLEEVNGGAILQALLTPIADAAMKAGELILAQGIAIQAFNESLKSLNGYAAIAAGTALIATAALVKSGLKALANSGSASYSAASGVASSRYSSSAYQPDWSMQQSVVTVTGTLTGKGSDLVAVVQSENSRTRRTT